MSADTPPARDTSPAPLPPSPAAALSQLLRGSLVTQLIHVAAVLGVADLLRAGPKSSHELATAMSVNPQALYRVLRALASLGIFVEAEPGAVFNEHQTNMTRQDAAAVVAAYDFAEYTVVIDVGRGQGALIEAAPA